MKRYLAYFDYLGFKEFIENNDSPFQKEILMNNFRDMEMARSDGKFKEGRSGGFHPDTDKSAIHCVNFSDTVVFITKDDKLDSFKELIAVAYRFNWQCTGYTFPVRGCIVFDEIEFIGFTSDNLEGSKYNVNTIYGKGLVKAHIKADSQQWAGTVIDQSVIDELNNNDYEIDALLLPFAKKFIVPYKTPNQIEEYVLNLVKGKLNETAFENVSKGIIRNFGEYGKSVVDENVQLKIANTIKFLESFREGRS